MEKAQRDDTHNGYQGDCPQRMDTSGVRLEKSAWRQGQNPRQSSAAARDNAPRATY